MKPEAQHLAIATAHGWNWIIWGKDQIRVYAPKGSKPNWSGEDKDTNSMMWPCYGQPRSVVAQEFILRSSSDYLNDLNAMREVRQVSIVAAAQRADYVRYLEGICLTALRIAGNPVQDKYDFANATAAMCAQAVLRALNLWVEEAV